MMDTSKKYIKMCEKAEEIQTIWGHGGGWLNGDFVYRKKDCKVYVLYSNEHHGFPPYTYLYPNAIWLPRQDQLQEMVGYKNDYMNLMYKVWDNLGNYRVGGYYPPKYLEWNTGEKFWLGIVMYEKYNKIWDDKKEEWMNNDN